MAAAPQPVVGARQHALAVHGVAGGRSTRGFRATGRRSTFMPSSATMSGGSISAVCVPWRASRPTRSPGAFGAGGRAPCSMSAEATATMPSRSAGDTRVAGDDPRSPGRGRSRRADLGRDCHKRPRDLSIWRRIDRRSGRERLGVGLRSHVVHHFDEATNARLVHRVGQALRPGGVLAVLDVLRPVSPQERARPARCSTLLSPLQAAREPGREGKLPDGRSKPDCGRTNYGAPFGSRYNGHDRYEAIKSRVKTV